MSTKTTQYLRIKKWHDHQHYKDRAPHWIKLHARLLRDSDFIALTERVQYQLIRIWLIASQSSLSTLDDDANLVPVIPHNAGQIRRAIGTLQRLELTTLINAGWLIVTEESAIFRYHRASTRLETRARDASAALAPVLAPSSSREVEIKKELALRTKNQGSNGRPSANATGTGATYVAGLIRNGVIQDRVDLDVELEKLPAEERAALEYQFELARVVRAGVDAGAGAEEDDDGEA